MYGNRNTTAKEFVDSNFLTGPERSIMLTSKKYPVRSLLFS